jgi:hypothetical protein
MCVYAVDGILLGLLRAGVQFARIGSLKHVAPPILCHMIHMGKNATGSHGQQESEKTALHDLQVRLILFSGTIPLLDDGSYAPHSKCIYVFVGHVRCNGSE